jgi:hypothetical protein
MGFLRSQQEAMAVRFLTWQYQKNQVPLPPEAELKRQAETLVADAHRIARERGQNVLAIIKEMAQEIRKK